MENRRIQVQSPKQKDNILKAVEMKGKLPYRQTLQMHTQKQAGKQNDSSYIHLQSPKGN